MRLFVAVELDPAVRRAAARLAADVGRRLAPGGGRGIGWVAEENLHVTVRFLGEVDAGTARRLSERLQPALAVDAFDVAVSGAGAFPPSGPLRVVWLGLTEGGDSLVRVHREVEARLDGLGFDPDDRPFHPHLTVGRVKGPLPGRPRDVLAEFAAAPVGRCRVTHVTLFESRLSPRGPSYSRVLTTALSG